MRNDDARYGGHGRRRGGATLSAGSGVVRLALVLLLPLLLGAADDSPTDIVAQRGDVKLTAADVRDMVEHTDPAMRAQMLANAAALADFVRDRLLRRTLLQEARAVKWEENPDVIARINEARETVIVQTYLASKVPPDPAFPSQADVAAAYEANKARFPTPRQFHIAQIAILVPPGGSKEVDEEAHRKALAVRQQALKPKTDFSELAKKESQDRTSADRGGDMDWLRDDQLVPSVRDAVANLAVNAISEPVRSNQAWHVVKLLGVKQAGFLPLERVRETLVQALRQNRAQQLARAYVEDLIHKEPIQLNEIDLAHRLAADH